MKTGSELRSEGSERQKEVEEGPVRVPIPRFAYTHRVPSDSGCEFSSLREGTSGNGVGDVFRSAADGTCGCTYTYAQSRSRSLKVAQERPRSLRVLQGRSTLIHFDTFVDVLI